MDNKYEKIVPWNGANDTGKDVRLKLERNFAKIGLNFDEVLGKLVSADDLFALIAEELENKLSRVTDDRTQGLIDFLKGLTVNGDKASIDKDGNAIIQQLIAKGGIIAMTPKSISQLRSFISEAITEEGDTSEQLMSDNVIETDEEDSDSPESAMMAEGLTEIYTGTDGGASTLGGLDNVEDSFDTLANGKYGFEMRDGMLCPTESVVIGSLPGTAYDGAKGAALEQAVKEISGGGSGTMYNTYIRNNLDSLAFATQLNEECIIDFTFISLYRDDISEPYKQTGETGICTMMVKNAKYPDFTVVKQFEVSSAVSIKQEVSSYLSSGSNNVKLSIKGNNTDSTTNPITYTITLTSLGVSAPNFSWWTAYSKDFIIPMIISGNINKTLYVNVTGENYSQSYTQNLGTATYVDTPYNYTVPHPGKNGVFNISFYLTNSDETIQTKDVSVNVMCIKTSTEAVKLMCVNNVSSLLINWESNTVFNYSIYDGQATSTGATFLVTKSGSEVYRSENDSIVTNTKNTFTYPMEVETDDDASFQVTISTVNSDSLKLITPITIDVNNSLGYSATSGATLYINPRTRSNSQSNYLSVINEVNKSAISAVWTAMNWSNDGWYEDSEGNKALKIFARSSVAIDYQPFLTEAARIGKTIEIDFKVENASDASKDIISIAETNSSGARVGLKVSGDNVSFFSASKQDNTTQDLPIDNNTRVRLTVVVMPDAYGNSGFNLACLYINGKKNRVYNYESNDYFKNNGKILLGNDYANLYIYGIRVYNFALTENAVRKNYVNQLSTTSEKQTETAINKVFDAEGTNIDFDAVKNLFNCFVIDQKFPNLNNPGAVSGSLDVYFKDKPERNFHITNILWEGQGTSSKKYYEWNVRGKLNKGLDANGVAQNSTVTYADGTTESKKVRMFLGVPKANKLTAKKNWASSMQDHKAGSVSAFNDLFKKQGLTNEAITANKEVRVAVYQEPFIGFSKQLNEEGQYIYVCMGEFTFGPDKGDSACFGYDTATFPNLLSVEGSDNAPLGALFRVPWNRSNPYWKYSAGSEAFQYNSANCWDFDGGDLNSEGTEPKSTQLWVDAYNSVYVCSNRIKPFNGTLDELNLNVTTYRGTGYEYWISKSGDANRYNLYYYEAAEGKFISSDIGNGQINLKTQLAAYLPSDISGYTDNALNTLFINARVSLFVATSPTYWDIDDSVLAYVDTEFRAGTDERAKNTYPYTFGTPTSKWKWRKDDTDTIGPIDNQGQDKKPYWVEMHDVYSNGQPVWNGETSVFWNLLELGFKQKIISGARTMLSNMEALSGQSSGTPYDKVYAFYKKYFLGVKTYFPSAIVNADAKRFEDAKLAYIAGNYVNDTDPITQSHGDFYSAETAWFKKRIMYIMSKYNYGLFSTNGTDTIIVRAAGNTINYDITPAFDMYPAIANGTSIVQGARTKAGEVCRISIDLGGSADQQNAIQAASWLLSIGKWYDKNVSGTMIVRGRRLTTLELGSKTENVVISITGLTLSDCGSLQKVILSRIATLQGVLDLSTCTNLREVRADGTALSQVKLPQGGGVELVEYPANNKYLNLQNFPKLPTSGLIITECMPNITDFFVVDCPLLQPMQILSNILSAQTSQGVNHVLKRIRAIGFYETYHTGAVLESLGVLANGSFEGLDSNGVAGNDEYPVLDGTLNVYSNYYKDTVDNLRAIFTRLILNVIGSTWIRFKDSKFLAVLLPILDSNGDGGITEAEAQTTINNLNTYNWSGVQIFEWDKLVVNAQSYPIPTSMKEVYLGKNIGAYGISFANATSLEKIDFTKFSNPNTQAIYLDTIVHSGMLSGCKGLKTVTLKQNTTAIGSSSFNDCTSLVNMPRIPDTCTSIGMNASTGRSFYGCTSLTRLILGSGIKDIATWSFGGCTSMQSFYIKAITPPTLANTNAFSNNSCNIYVPVGSGSLYKSASNWSSFASRIYEYDFNTDPNNINS